MFRVGFDALDYFYLFDDGLVVGEGLFGVTVEKHILVGVAFLEIPQKRRGLLLGRKGLLKNPQRLLRDILKVWKTDNLWKREVILGILGQDVHINPYEVLLYHMFAWGHNKSNFFPN